MVTALWPKEGGDDLEMHCPPAAGNFWQMVQPKIQGYAELWNSKLPSRYFINTHFLIILSFKVLFDYYFSTQTCLNLYKKYMTIYLVII